MVDIHLAWLDKVKKVTLDEYMKRVVKAIPWKHECEVDEQTQDKQTVDAGGTELVQIRKDADYSLVALDKGSHNRDKQNTGTDGLLVQELISRKKTEESIEEAS